MTNPVMLTYTQAAAMIGVSRPRVSQLVDEEKLTPVEVSPGRKYLRKSDVEAYRRTRRADLRRRLATA